LTAWLLCVVEIESPACFSLRLRAGIDVFLINSAAAVQFIGVKLILREREVDVASRRIPSDMQGRAALLCAIAIYTETRERAYIGRGTRFGRRRKGSINHQAAALERGIRRQR